MTAIKNDSEKQERPELIDAYFIKDLAAVLAHGAKKYGDYNWQGGDDAYAERIYGAAQRHLLAWKCDDKLDEETTINHLIHATANLMFLYWYDYKKKKII